MIPIVVGVFAGIATYHRVIHIVESENNKK